MIPKIIHQTWKTNQIPDNWINAVESCKKLYNDYQYILWTHETMDKFVKKEFPHFYNVYSSYKADIQRCDAFRYLILYKYGGIYLDLDIICKKKFDNLLKYDLVLVRSPNNKFQITNSFYMSIPNHPFIKFCIDNLPSYKDSFKIFGKHWHIMNSTGPWFLTKMMFKYNQSNIKNIYFLNNDEFAGDCNSCNENACKGGIYFRHIVGNSWHSFDSVIYNKIFCNWKIILLTAFIFILLIILYKNPFIAKKIKKFY